MKRITIIFIIAILNAAPATISSASDTSMVLEMHKIETETINKIQTDIVDPLLGKGNAFVFADIEMEVVTRESEQSSGGYGQISKNRSRNVSTETVTDKDEVAESTKIVTNRYKAAEDKNDLFKGFDFSDGFAPASKPKTGQDTKQKPEETEKTATPAKSEAPAKEEASSSQWAQQSRKSVEKRLGLELETTNFSLSILHDSVIPKEKLDLVRTIILSIYPHAVKKQGEILSELTITFIPAPFAKKERKWW